MSFNEANSGGPSADEGDARGQRAHPAPPAASFRDGDTVVFFGDSLTHGGFYHEYLADFYRTRFPEADIRFVNSGIGGDTAAGAMPRIPVDVAEYRPTWVFYHFGMNDVNRGAYVPNPTPEQVKRAADAAGAFRRNFAALAEGVRAAVPGVREMFATPTIYDETAVVDDIPPDAAEWATVNQVGRHAALRRLREFVKNYAAERNAPVVDWHAPLDEFVNRRRRAGDAHFRVTRFDRVHPGVVGHAIMSWEFLKAQGVSATVSDIEIDAASGRAVRAENATVGEVVRQEDGLACTVLEKSLPFPVPDEAREFLGEFGVEEALNREVFAVKGLPEGNYALLIDGVEVACGSAATFAEGLRLGFNPKTPQYAQARAFFERNAELAARERLMRNAHSGRWFYGQRGAPVDDVAAFAAWFEQNEKDKSAYFAGFVPAYLKYWPTYRESRAALLADQQAARALVKPVPHRYEVRRLTADPNLSVFVSDIHISGPEVMTAWGTQPTYQNAYFKRTVDDILAMRPRPARVVCFGDVALWFGFHQDYETALPLLRRLTDAGIEVFVTTGNHDHRDSMARYFPRQAAASPVPGRFVSVIDLGAADLILLDTLWENEDGEGSNNNVGGKLDEAQWQWLRKRAGEAERPFFVGAHHPSDDVGIGDRGIVEALADNAMFAGYIYGHKHRWNRYWHFADYSTRRLKRSAGLPSTGWNGDIGYATMRTFSDRAELALFQTDYFWPIPLKDGETRPRDWDVIISENRASSRVTFPYRESRRDSQL